MRLIFAAILVSLICFNNGVKAGEVEWPMPGQEAVLMNTISTLQFYGPKAGFHHGLDLVAPAGTRVVAPVSGKIETGYYYKRKSDYTYEIAITTANGERWELHHIDPDSIPEEVEQIAKNQGEIQAGAFLAEIYDASEIGIEPHLHINVVSAEGMYQNPLIHLQSIGDNASPTIANTWLAQKINDKYVETKNRSAGVYYLIIDAFDMAPGAYARQSLYKMKVTQGDESIFEFVFDKLPHASFLEGVDDIYFLSDLKTLDGNIVRSRVKDDRKFLYAIKTQIPERGVTRIEIEVEDFYGNSKKSIVSLNN